VIAVVVEPLGGWHDRAKFSCGHADLDDWFRRRAGQDERRNIARVFVAVHSELGMVGFYSLGTFKVDLDELPEEIARRLPRYDGIPTALIGRLARDVRVRGQGVGEILLADALRRILNAARSLAVFAIMVDAKDDRAVAFYETYGFRRFPLRPNRLFLLASSAATALERM
jgi:ribosomal protein S18 acetylase RimI-like enzyme